MTAPAGLPQREAGRVGSERPAAAEEEFAPLGGIRMADFSTNMAGPYATMILAQLGADVVKVESLGGDDARAWPPVIDGGSLSHRHVNAGKRGIVVDLKAREGREVALALAGGCDVLLQSMRPGVADRIGIRAGEDPRASGAVGRNGPGRHGLQPRPVPGRERAHHRTAPGAGRLGQPDRGALPMLPCPRRLPHDRGTEPAAMGKRSRRAGRASPVARREVQDRRGPRAPQRRAHGGSDAASRGG